MLVKREKQALEQNSVMDQREIACICGWSAVNKNNRELHAYIASIAEPIDITSSEERWKSNGWHKEAAC